MVTVLNPTLWWLFGSKSVWKRSEEGILKWEEKQGRRANESTERCKTEGYERANKSRGAFSFLKYSCCDAAPLIKRREKRGEGARVGGGERKKDIECRRKETEKLQNKRENEEKAGKIRGMVNGGSRQIRTVRGMTARTKDWLLQGISAPSALRLSHSFFPNLSGCISSRRSLSRTCNGSRNTVIGRLALRWRQWQRWPPF